MAGMTSIPSTIYRLVGRSSGFGNIGADVEEIATVLAEDSAYAYGSAAGIAAIDILVGAAMALLDIAFLPIIILALLVVLALFGIVYALRGHLGGVFLVGKALGSFANFAVNGLEQMATWVIGQAENRILSLLHSVVHLVHWAVYQTSSVGNNAVDALVAGAIEPVHHEVDTLWGWVNTIQGQVHNLEMGIAGSAHGITALPGIITEDIHALQRDVGHAAGSIQAILTTIAAQGEDIRDIYEILQKIGAHAVGIRAVNTGWQDIVGQVDALGQDIVGLEQTYGKQIAGIATAVATVAPLAILADAGVRGLNNLRRLEDTPCMCPRLPGVMNEVALAMGVLHHLKGD